MKGKGGKLGENLMEGGLNTVHMIVGNGSTDNPSPSSLGLTSHASQSS